MLIDCVPDVENGPGAGDTIHMSNESRQLKANEDMAHTCDFAPGPVDGEALTAADLVLLYENIDPDNRPVMADAEENKTKRSNQHVETVVYNGNDSDTSDISEESIPEDLQHYLLMNEEQIDIFGCGQSNENRLTHKIGELALQLSNLTVQYDQQFNDSCIKNRLNSFNFNCVDGSRLKNTLLDYIYCRRVDDNYSLYMENVISYVNYTIEQLKRISNGDYLSPKVQAKWREINGDDTIEKPGNDVRALMKSSSYPLQSPDKVSDQAVKWEDLVHSEVDVRSLAKMFHKRIVIEIPRLIYDTKQLFSEHCKDNLIISCQCASKTQEVVNVKSANCVDVMFQLKCSEPEYDVKTTSVVRFQGAALPADSVSVKQSLPIAVEENQDTIIDNGPKVIELCEQNTQASDYKETTISEDLDNMDELYTDFAMQLINDDYNEDYQKNINKVSEHVASSDDDTSNLSDASSGTNGFLGLMHKMKKTETLASNNFFNPTPPADLKTTLKNLNIQSSLPEEIFEGSSTATSMKKKFTNDKFKTKSPYENAKSPLEETKRKRLLEIREKRERRKNAAIENSKVAKYKLVKPFPQSSHSVTKLSITNKSFYNSIYGNTNNSKPPKQAENKERKKQKRPATVEDTHKRLDIEGVQEESTALPSDHNSHKFDIDETITEMMYLQMKRDGHTGSKEKFISSPSVSTSAVSGNDAIDNLHILSPNVLIPNFPSSLYGSSNAKVPSIINKYQDSKSAEQLQSLCKSITYNEKKIPTSNIPANVVKLVHVDADNPKENTQKNEQVRVSSTECRKNIDKIYNLMKQMTNTGNGNARSVAKPAAVLKPSPVHESSTSHVSDTESSVSPDKRSNNLSKYKDTYKYKPFNNKKTDISVALVPKVIISTKLQNMKMESDDKKKSILKERKRVTINPSNKVRENPMKAISLLLQEFDNVHSNKQRQAVLERFANKLKKHDRSADDKNNKSVYTQGNWKLDQLTHEYDQNQRLGRLDECISPREKRKNCQTEFTKTYTHKENRIDNLTKKNIVDIIDEAKEARGEAVRGPSKHSPARLNALAQPRKSYVQAHSEEFQRRYGRNLMADRLQRLANIGMPTMLQRPQGTPAFKTEKKKNDKTVNAFYEKPSNPIPEFINSHYEVIPILTNEQSTKRLTVPVLQDQKTKSVAFESHVKCHYGNLKYSKGKHQAAKNSAVLSLNDNKAASGSSSEGKMFEDSSMLCRVNSMSDAHTYTFNSFPKSDIEKNGDIDNTTEIVESERQLKRIPENNLLLVSSNTMMNTNKTHNNKVEDIDNECLHFKRQLDNVENSVCHRVTSGAFQQRLNYKSGVIPPKNSNHQIFLVSSCTSLRLSSESKIFNIPSDSDQLSVLEILPVLSNNNLKWSFTNLPMQIATVGYALPQCKASNSSFKSRDIDDSSNKDKSESYFKSPQYINRIKKHAKENIEDVNYSNNLESNKTDDGKAVIVKSTTYIIEQDNDTMLRKKHMELNDSSRVVSVSTEQYPHGVSSDTLNSPNSDLDNIDCTSSLDILIGLLNEIKSISSCQAHITTDFNVESEKVLSQNMEAIIASTQPSSTGIEDDTCKLIINNAADNQTYIKSTDNISVVHLPNSDDMNKSISDNVMDEQNSSCEVMSALFYNDKEVNVDLSKKSRFDIFTNAPSTQFIPLAANRATNVPHSQLNVYSQLSSHSIFSLNEFYLGKTSNGSHNKIVEVPLLAESKCNNNDVSKERSNCTTVVYQHKEVNYSMGFKKEGNQNSEDFSKTKSKEIKTNKSKEKYQHSCTFQNEYDPLIKIKREILVTLYSVLALTVFGALSFSEILYHL